MEPNKVEFVGSAVPRLPVKVETREVVVGIANEGLPEAAICVGRRKEVLVARSDEPLLKISMVPLSVGSNEACSLGREVTLLNVLLFGDGEESVLFGRSVGRLRLDVVFENLTLGEIIG